MKTKLYTISLFLVISSCLLAKNVEKIEVYSVLDREMEKSFHEGPLRGDGDDKDRLKYYLLYKVDSQHPSHLTKDGIAEVEAEIIERLDIQFSGTPGYDLALKAGNEVLELMQSFRRELHFKHLEGKMPEYQ